MRLLAILACLCSISPVGASPRASHASASDSLYRAHHPKLLFTLDELPALRSKVHDGGYDAEAYEYIRYLAMNVYPGETEKEFLEAHDTGIGDVPNLGVFAFIEQPMNAAAIDMGRRVTNYLVDSTHADDNSFFGPLRLRSLAFGYDMFFHDANPGEREKVVLEVESYIDTMLVGFWYDVWKHRPYLSNMTTMIASALGLAAICLDGETDPERVDAALAMADDFIDTWLTHQMDPDGSYKEGAMYAGWSMRHLTYYFWARKRYDGFDWADNPRIRNMEKWVAYSMLPVGTAEVNNLNDTASRNYPYARHHAYFDWAQTAWNSGLSLWLWERLLGPYGHDSGRLKGPTATVLWNRDLTPTHPSDVLPKHFLWKERGLYYFRTGWPQESLSDDVVFSFYSGKFHGGHSQEDQNTFTLYGYGERFAIDNGFLRPPWESEAHNLTFIDGKGQHHSGGSVGTDGNIAEYLLGDFADYIFGDATRAYTIHSEFNLPDVPYPGKDWSFGYDGGNPVEYAHRRFIIVHDNVSPPYFILVEDIRKDDILRTYDWRMHTDEENDVDLSSNPIRITGDTGRMDLHVLLPPFDKLQTSLGAFDNGHDDPNSKIVTLSLQTTSARFAYIFFPESAGSATAAVETEQYPWGLVARISHPSGAEDALLINETNELVTFTEGRRRISTDASLAVMRLKGNRAEQHILTHASHLSVDGRPLVAVHDGPLNVTVAGSSAHIDRPLAQFRFYAPRITEVWCRNERVPFVRRGPYVVADTTGTQTDRPPLLSALSINVFPSPLRSSSTIVVDAPRGFPLDVSVFDVRGRRVATLLRSESSGLTTLEWPGLDNHNRPLPSGVYFVRAESAGVVARKKLVILR